MTVIEVKGYNLFIIERRQTIFLNQPAFFKAEWFCRDKD